MLQLLKRLPPKALASHLLLFAGLAAMCPGQVVRETAPTNPISKLARMIEPELVNVEGQLAWLDYQAVTLANQKEHQLEYAVGYRGCRESVGAPDPTIVMDFREIRKLSTIYLAPIQTDQADGEGIFPKRFTLTVSDDIEFSNPKLIYKSDAQPHLHETLAPMKINTDRSGRYLKLSIQEGHSRGLVDLFGLSEIIVIANQEPISFGSTITASNELDIDGIFYADTLKDGRMPLGTWDHGKERPKYPGDLVEVLNVSDPISWTVELTRSQPLDHLILFPYSSQEHHMTLVMPDALQVEMRDGADQPWTTVQNWKNPLPGTIRRTPLLIPLEQADARQIRITSTQPWKMGGRFYHALSEIQVWSDASNVALHRTVTREHMGAKTEITSLTDDFSSERSIIPFDLWLKQLNARGRINSEREYLRSTYRKLASRSELNVTWGSAVILGLTFLIPVYIFERRRMQSREHIDEIRKRIASDLHDDIGSNLGSISLIARTARKDLARLQGPLEIDNDLGEVETIARESSLAMRDIVWLLERKQDSIGDLVHRMRETAGRLLREVDFNLECTSNNTAAKLSLDAKRHLFLFYKEAIHNIIKHSKADKVSVKMWDQGDKIGMQVTDNGIGLPVSPDGAKTHVKKLEDRAKVLHGSLHVNTSPETGTSVRLLVKRAHLTAQPNKSP